MMTEQPATLATLFGALASYGRFGGYHSQEQIVRAFATCASRRGGTGDALLRCAQLLEGFTIEEIGGIVRTDDPALNDALNALADAIVSSGSRACPLTRYDLADALRTRRTLLQTHNDCMGVFAAKRSNTDSPRIRAIGLVAIGDCMAQARRGITAIEAALFTALTGISVHVIGGVTAEPFTPADLYAAGFPKPPSLALSEIEGQPDTETIGTDTA